MNDERDLRNEAEEEEVDGDDLLDDEGLDDEDLGVDLPEDEEEEF